MTLIALDSTLAELVTVDPSLARELERRGLDYCCGGTRTLQQACAAQDLDAEAVVEELIGSGHSRRGSRRGPPWTPTSSSTTSRPPTTATSGTSCHG